MAKIMDSGLEESELELQSLYYIHFRTIALGKNMKSFIPPPMSKIVPLLFFH